MNFSTLHCHLSLYWKLSVSAHLHQTFTIQLPCSCDAVLRAQIHVRFGGNHSYPPTHTTFSPEFFVDCWLVKSHEVHTVVVVSADASGFEKECRSPEQWGGGGGGCQPTVSNCMRWGQDRQKLSAARKAQIPFRRGRECKKLSSGGSRNEIWQVEFKSRTNKSISVSSWGNG